MVKRILLVAGLIFILLVSSPLMATPLLTPGTMADYIALGSTGGLIGDKLFYDFTYSGTGSGGATAIPPDGVTVTPITLPFNPGLIFNAPWTVGPGQTLDSMINYKVLVLAGGAPITDISASMAGYGRVPDGIVAVAETTTVGNLLLYDSALGVVAYDVLSIPPTMGPITVYKDISVNGNSGLATVSGVWNQFSETPVPEPATMLLLGSGLIGLAGYGRKKFFKK